MKIFINTIMKNESANIDKFYDTCSWADGIYVLDTGSTDNSIEKFKSKGSNVFIEQKIYDKLYFDEARKDAQKLLPQEEAWVINLDLDEFLVGDWKTFLLNLPKEYNNIQYPYAFNHEEPHNTFYVNKVVKNGTYYWDYPIHECVFPNEKWETFTTHEFQIHQKQDKSKTRNYKKLLEQCIESRPDYELAKFYLLKEYFNSGEIGKSIDFSKVIFDSKLPNDIKMVTWLLLYRCYKQLECSREKLEECLINAYMTCSWRREPYMDMMRFYNEERNYLKVFWAGTNLFNITQRPIDFYEMYEAWTSEPYQLYIEACNNLGYFDLARIKFIEVNDIMLLRHHKYSFYPGLYDLLSSIEGENLTVLEIGSYTGESTEVFANSPKIRKVIAVDPWLDEEKCEHYTFNKMNLVETIFDHRLQHHKKVEKIKSKIEDIEIPEVDIVYIDAIHTYKGVKKDIDLVKNKVKMYICGHDYSQQFKGVMQAVDELAKELNKQVMVFSDTSWRIKL